MFRSRSVGLCFEVTHCPLNTEINICVLSLIGMLLENRSILVIDIYKIFHEWTNNNFNLFIYPLISSGIQKFYKIYINITIILNLYVVNLYLV